jgi:hypothetical protein
MMNLDFFDGETEISEEKITGVHLSKYQLFKKRNHYRKSNGIEKCGNCAQHVSYKYHDKNYHKCRLIGISNSEATDIQVSAVCDSHRQEQ